MNTFKSIALITSVLLSTVLFSAPVSADPQLSEGGYNREAHSIAMMKMKDTNRDGTVSEEEFTAYHSRLFDVLDKDSSGDLDSTEWVGTKGLTEVSFATGGYMRQLQVMRIFDLKDANHDGKVTKDEFLTYHNKAFAALDTSGDKVINKHEWLVNQTGYKK